MERPTVRSYSIRGSRITVAQRQAKTALQMVHGIEFKQELIEVKAIFPNSQSIIMEIGFGMGEATAIIAKNHPNNGYIAVDVHPPGIGKLLARIVENNLTNLKVIEDDVHVVLQHMIPDESLDGIHLYFPDPWPKKKHNKRRIVNEGFLSLIHPMPPRQVHRQSVHYLVNIIGRNLRSYLRQRGEKMVNLRCMPG